MDFDKFSNCLLFPFPAEQPDQAPVVQTLDSAIQWIVQSVFLILIRWIVIFPMDSAIQRLNNRG